MFWLLFHQWVLTFLVFAIGVLAGWWVWGKRARALAAAEEANQGLKDERARLNARIDTLQARIDLLKETESDYKALLAEQPELVAKADELLRVRAREDCVYCADGAEFPGYIDYEGFCGR